MKIYIEGRHGKMDMDALDRLARKNGGVFGGSGVFLPTMTRDATYQFKRREGGLKFMASARACGIERIEEVR